MSSRVLSTPVFNAPATPVSHPSHVLDDLTRALVEREAAQAHAAGVAQGRAEALEAARAEAASVAVAVEAAAGRVLAAVQAQHDALADALAARVLDCTRAVLGTEPSDDGATLVARLRAALARVDDPRLVLRVAPGREAVVREAVAQRHDVTVQADDTLDGDDLVVTGDFVDVDLRAASLLGALAALLEDAPGLGPLADDGGAA